jgi:hypothetical protein
MKDLGSASRRKVFAQDATDVSDEGFGNVLEHKTFSAQDFGKLEGDEFD